MGAGRDNARFEPAFLSPIKVDEGESFVALYCRVLRSAVKTAKPKAERLRSRRKSSKIVPARRTCPCVAVRRRGANHGPSPHVAIAVTEIFYSTREYVVRHKCRTYPRLVAEIWQVSNTQVTAVCVASTWRAVHNVQTCWPIKRMDRSMTGMRAGMPPVRG